MWYGNTWHVRIPGNKQTQVEMLELTCVQVIQNMSIIWLIWNNFELSLILNIIDLIILFSDTFKQLSHFYLNIIRLKSCVHTYFVGKFASRLPLCKYTPSPHPRKTPTRFLYSFIKHVKTWIIRSDSCVGHVIRI